MALILPIAKFLLKWVAPNIPEIVSTIATIKQQQGTRRTEGETFEERVANIDHKFAQQLELIETLTRQVQSLKAILRWTLIIGMVALLLSLTGLVIMFAT